MASVSYIPTAFTLGKDFQSAIQYLKEHDPVSLIMLPDDQKEEFVQGTISLFFGKIGDSHKFRQQILETAHANIRLLIGSAEQRHGRGYSDDKVREQWCRDVPPYIRTVMTLATLPSEAQRSFQRELAYS